MSPGGASFCLIFVLSLSVRLSESMPEVAEYALQDLHLTAEERLGICRRGSELYFENEWIPGRYVCGCCLRPSRVFYTKCPQIKADGQTPEKPGGSKQACEPQPATFRSCCVQMFPQTVAKWFQDRKSQRSKWKRIFDLPTENSTAKVKQSENDSKFGGVSGKIVRKRHPMKLQNFGDVAEKLQNGKIVNM